MAAICSRLIISSAISVIRIKTSGSRDFWRRDLKNGLRYSALCACVAVASFPGVLLFNSSSKESQHRKTVCRLKIVRKMTQHKVYQTCRSLDLKVHAYLDADRDPVPIPSGGA